MSVDSYKATEQLLGKIEMDSELVVMPGAKCYSKDVVEPDSEGRVSVSPLVGADEKIFMSPTSLNTGVGITKVLLKKVGGLKNPDALYEPDVEFLLAAIRTLTFTPLYNVSGVCQECGEEFEAEVSIDQIPCDHYEEEDLQSEFMLKNGQTVKARFLTFGEIRTFDEDGNVEYNEARIVSVDGITDRGAISKWYRKLPLGLKKELRDNLLPELGGFRKNGIIVNCPNKECGKETIVSIDILRDFFVQILV